MASSRTNRSRMVSLDMCSAGPTMWLGCSPAIWTIYAPRSVSSTSRPWLSSAVLRPISSVSVLLLLTMRRASCRSIRSRTRRLASLASSAHSTCMPLACIRASACSSRSGRWRRARRLASAACWRMCSPCSRPKANRDSARALMLLVVETASAACNWGSPIAIRALGMNWLESTSMCGIFFRSSCRRAGGVPRACAMTPGASLPQNRQDRE